jgi:hypothetical protein
MSRIKQHTAILTAYVIVVDLAALAMLAFFPAHDLTGSLANLLILLALIAILGAQPIRIQSLRIQVAALDLFILSTLLLVDPLAAPLVALVGVAAAVFGPGRRPMSLRTVFNLGVVPLSASVAAVIYLKLVGEGSDPMARFALPLAAATAAYFLVNTILAAVPAAIESRKDIFTAWLGIGPWNGVSTLASMVMAIGLAVLVQAFGPGVLALGLLISIPIMAQGRLREREESSN